MTAYAILPECPLLQETLDGTTVTEGLPQILTNTSGILSPHAEENPAFADWTHVYLWYCTSDSGLGEILLCVHTKLKYVSNQLLNRGSCHSRLLRLHRHAIVDDKRL